ncbi:hypothetical protein [Rhodopirellula sp. MGV]|uniref:hypothetical protein n=1 Tax=Rhodopirellula sp. MGV TaxID=2023130 RepID=UPI00117A9BBA|nr:hypothetical protein [Rhodopirellula sp. MGV]
MNQTARPKPIRIALSMIAITTGLACTSVTALAEDTPNAPTQRASGLIGDLFSKITMSQTVAATQINEATAQAKTSDRIVGEVSLGKFLSGYDIQHSIESQTVRVQASELFDAAETSSDESAAFLFRVDADSQRIDIHLPIPVTSSLATSPRQGELLYQAITELSKLSNVQLVIENDSIVLHTSMGTPNASIEDMRRVAGVLQDASSSVIARLVSESDDSVAQQSPAVEPATPPTAIDASQMVGTWSAKVSAKQAWAIRFDDQSNFVLVYTQNGKNQVSQGQFKLADDALILQGKGITLNGSVTMQNDQLIWQLKDANNNPTIKLDFKKQS